ncbi:hypothetical protein [Paenibacillus agilis]|uniref:Copper amine oxidase-like N-terminal domain-containing protein n=1 Tax=Paenibacillus agilis TaxID=3020863 RepID=A0A559IQ72_9BACL|nr:hypothetical protein [Paenibacillus agilis]TVX89683.1 hypothetical protein FPZ44_18135 [Paenibacillus agilis]
MIKNLKIHLAWLTIVLLITGTTVVASNEWVVTKYEGSIFFEGKELGNHPNMPFLQKDGLTYIPVRAIENASIGFTRYDSANKSIYIDMFNFVDGVGGSSNLYAESEDTLFHLRINSSKERYSVGEPLAIWSVLSNRSDKQAKIHHGSPLLHYYVKDAKGSMFGETRASALRTSTVAAHFQEARPLSRFTAYQYNRGSSPRYDLEGGEEIFKKEITRPLHLPAGTYTIGVVADYRIPSDYPTKSFIDLPEHRLESSIQITIE